MYKDFYNNKLVPFVNKVRMACNVGEIPLVFDNSLTYYEQIAAFSAKLNDVISTVNVQSLTLCEFMQQLTEAFKELSDDFAAQWADIQAAFVQLSGRVNVLDERVTALENLPLGVGIAIPEGTEYIEPGEDPYIAGLNAEIFNCYEDTESSNKNRAAGDYSHAEGDSTKAYATSSHCEGSRTTAFKSAAHAEGMDTTADGLAAHAGGRASFALDAYAFAHGNVATASGEASTAFGSNTTASGTSSFAEGAGTSATGNYSHAGGGGCTASGNNSFVHGAACIASGHNSAAFGAATVAGADNQLVCGYSNLERDNTYIFIVGNGRTGAEHSNAFEVDNRGNIFTEALDKAVNVMIEENRAALVELVDVTGKNKLAFSEIGTNDSHGSTFTSNGVSWTLNQDGSITATRTESSATDSSCNLRIATGSLYIDDYCDNAFMLSGCPEGGGAETYALRALRGDDYRVTDTGSGALLIGKGYSTDIYINMIYYATYSGTITFKPMICSTAAWNISQEWIAPEIIT